MHPIAPTVVADFLLPNDDPRGKTIPTVHTLMLSIVLESFGLVFYSAPKVFSMLVAVSTNHFAFGYLFQDLMLGATTINQPIDSVGLIS
jgi:hypothetical protein